MRVAGDHENLPKEIDQLQLRKELERGIREGCIFEGEWFCQFCGRLYHRQLGAEGYRCHHHPQCPNKDDS